MDDYVQTHLATASVLQNETGLPVNVELMTVQVSDLGKNFTMLLRLAHQFGAGEDATLSQPVTVDLRTLFNEEPGALVELSLTANQPLGAHKGYTWNTKATAVRTVQYEAFERVVGDGESFVVTIGPAEIRTFNLTFGCRQLVRISVQILPAHLVRCTERLEHGGRWRWTEEWDEAGNATSRGSNCTVAHIICTAILSLKCVPGVRAY